MPEELIVSKFSIFVFPNILLHFKSSYQQKKPFSNGFFNNKNKTKKTSNENVKIYGVNDFLILHFEFQVNGGMYWF